MFRRLGRGLPTAARAFSTNTRRLFHDAKFLALFPVAMIPVTCMYFAIQSIDKEERDKTKAMEAKRDKAEAAAAPIFHPHVIHNSENSIHIVNTMYIKEVIIEQGEDLNVTIHYIDGTSMSEHHAKYDEIPQFIQNLLSSKNETIYNHIHYTLISNGSTTRTS